MYYYIIWYNKKVQILVIIGYRMVSKENSEERDDISKDLELDKKKEMYPIDALKLDKTFYSVFELKRKRDKEIIKLNPEFQRNDVWKKPQKIELVESVLMGLPLPIFYFNRDKNGKLIVVDGRQRLTALFSYMEDEFRLEDLKVLSQDFEKKFSELPQIYQSKIEDFQLIAYEITPETPESVLYNIFDRVNRGGTSLNKQEIRNALYQGKSTKLLNEIVKSDLFKTATGKGLEKDNRQKAQYILLRFIAFYLQHKEQITDIKGNIYKYKDIDNFLSRTMEVINEYDDIGYNSLRDKVIYTLNNCKNYTDENIFRLIINGQKSPINMNVFETIMYIMSFLSDNLDRKTVFEKINNLKNSQQFRENIGNHRDAESNVNERFSMADKIIKELQNDK